MLEVVFYLAGFAGALWLAIAAVDGIVAVMRREWQFNIRRLLMLTAVVSLVLGVFVTLLRR